MKGLVNPQASSSSLSSSGNYDYMQSIIMQKN